MTTTISSKLRMFVLIVAIVVVLQQLLSLLWLVSILSSLQIIVVRTSTRTNAANKPSCLTGIRFNTIAFTSTINTTIMITGFISTICISVAVTITLPSVIVLIHIIMINTIVAIIVKLVSNCIMNVTIVTASNNASKSIPAQVLLFSLLLLVRVPSSAQ